MINYSQIESLEQITNCKKQLQRRIDNQEKTLTKDVERIKSNFSVVSTVGRTVFNIASLTHSAALASRRGLFSFFTLGFKVARAIVNRRRR